MIQCISFALWALSDTFTMSSQSIETVWMLDRVSAVGYTTFSALVLHFFLVITGYVEKVKHPRLIFLLYIPAVIFFIKGVTGPLAVSGFIKTEYGWREQLPVGSLWYIAFSVYYAVYMLLSIFSAIYWWKTTINPRHKSQAWVLIITAVLPLVFSLITDVIFPKINVQFPPMTPVWILIWAIGVTYVVKKYQFMALNPESAAGAIIQQMDNMMFFLNQEGLITRINVQVEKLLNCYEHEIVGTDFSTLFSEPPRIESVLNSIESLDDLSVAIETEFKYQGADLVPARLMCTPVYDKNRYIIGIVVIGIDLRETRALQREIRERKKAEERLQESEAILRQRNEVIEKDLINAQLIERALFNPDEISLSNIRASYRHIAMDMIGGDYYTSFTIDEETAGFFISDVSGHGVSAALFLSLISFVVRKNIHEFGRDPSEFLAQLNMELIDSMSTFFLTAIYGIVQKEENKTFFRFARGGHTFPVYVSRENNSVEIIESRGPMIGQFRDLKYDFCQKEIIPGDRIYLYTDGLIEARGEDGRVFGFERFAELLLEASSLSLDDSIEEVIQKVKTFSSTGTVDDDILIVGIEVDR